MNSPKYWRGLEELEQKPEFLATMEKEFPTDVPIEDALSNTDEEALSFQTDRRNFLKLLGFGMTAATMAACVETPMKHAVPYVEKPEDIIPGVPNYYASTTDTGIPVVVKTREGRPIKLEGNPDSPLYKGAVDAVGQATLLNVYDVDRLKGPAKGGDDTNWTTIDSEVKAALASSSKVRVVSRSVLSPSTKGVIDEFLGGFADGQHVTYDPVSYSAIAESHEKDFGKKAVPSYSINNANVILGISCDFLGTWMEPALFNKQYAETRDPDSGSMSVHYQIESLLTTTGSNADLRMPVKPSQIGAVLLNLYNKVARTVGQPTIPGVPDFNLAANVLDKIAKDLAANAGKAVVLCGVNDVAMQDLVNGINYMIGAYGNTVDIDRPSYYKQGDDKAMATLAGELSSVDALFFYDANPVYDSPHAAAFKAALANTKLSVSLAYKADETSILCKYTAPDHHYLESWNDAMQVEGHYTLTQPTINPIYETRQAQDSFMQWGGMTGSYSDRIKNTWQSKYTETEGGSFRKFWEETLRKGVFTEEVTTDQPATFVGDIATAANSLKNNNTGDTPELVLYEKVSIRDGKYANNPWLQEMPDPITRATWDNYLLVPVQYATANNLKQNDEVNVTVGGTSLKLGVVVQPGQANNTFGIALGYGRPNGGRCASVIKGSPDVYPWVEVRDGNVRFERAGVEVAKTGGTYEIASIQTFHTLFDPAKQESFGNYYDRTEEIISETSFDAYSKNPDEVNSHRAGSYLNKRRHLITLWESHFKDKSSDRYIRWAMAIDLNKCTGCGACVVSCQAENNVPVVGKEEVMNRREMHWIRIDRYYSGSPQNPNVVFQPMLCQHCDNAPCETVCPVLATIHSHEGLNQMTYNRCVGTRYCANNCPYKVRRFNWFNYVVGDQFTEFNPAHKTNPLGYLVLNPDVTVRFRGVMEKCSFCVQRLQDGKLKAKLRAGTSLNSDGSSVKPVDGEIQTACQQSCPTGAIVFGDLNDPESAVHKLYKENQRIYHALEEVKTLPSVAYMTKVRNRDAEIVNLMKEGYGGLETGEKAMEDNSWLM